MPDDPTSYRTEPNGEFADRLERELLQRLAATSSAAPTDPANGTLTVESRVYDWQPSETPVVDVVPEPERGPHTTTRRWLVVAAAVTIIVIVAAVLTYRSGDDTTHIVPAGPGLTATTKPPPSRPLPAAPPRVIPLPPEGAAPSAPVEGVPLLSLQACSGPSSLPWSGNLTLYEDGRLLWHTNDDPFEGDGFDRNGPRPKTAWLEQRLTPEGTELLRSELVSGGLLGPGQLYTDCPAGSYLADARIGDHYEYYKGKLPRDLVERIAEPASWLPANAWEDREVRPFVPASYGVSIAGLEPRLSVAEITTALPAPLGDLVRARDWGENHDGPSRWFWGTAAMSTEDARTFAEALDAAAIARSEHPWLPGPEYLFEYQDGSRSELLHIMFGPGTPGQIPSSQSPR